MASVTSESTSWAQDAASGTDAELVEAEFYASVSTRDCLLRWAQSE